MGVVYGIIWRDGDGVGGCLLSRL